MSDLSLIPFFVDVHVLIWLAITFSIASAAVAIFQRLFVGLYAHRTRQALEKENSVTDFAPETALILCLRGADPSLTECLKSIEKQEFTNFHLHIVVDDLTDPALIVVNDVLAGSTIESSIHCIEERGETCSLKCSAIITAINNLPATVEAVALIDADAVVPPSWLGTLLAPLSNPEVGASTGNRWFRIPTSHHTGAAVRGVWNAAAVVQMYLYEIPWGGTLALRRDVIDQVNLLEHWSQGFCEDTMLTRILHQGGYRIARPVELIVVNDESTTVGGSFRWIQRQLLTVRLHHPRWFWVYLHGLATGLPLLGIGLTILSIFMGATTSTTVLLVTLGLFEAAAILTLIRIIEVHQPLLKKGKQFKPFGREIIFYTLAVPLTQLLHFAATLQAAWAKRVNWREIEYTIADNQVRLTQYRPYAELQNFSETTVNSIE